jgi:hypothetical protein
MVSEDRLRGEFFAKSRSPKYAAGDTRGWKLVAARERLQQEDGWRDFVKSCHYRPFDRRSIYWADWMVDWPRTDVMRHFLAGENLALVARRQMLPGRECNYFWVTDGITIDGIIRSDNRGSESIFPLFLYEQAGTGAPAQLNFSDGFHQAVRDILPERPLDFQGHTGRRAGPVRWLGYLYAQFFSNTYRQRYADLLRADFPRVFLTSDHALWDRLSELGCRLMAEHLGGGGRQTELLVGCGPGGIPPSEGNVIGSLPAEVASGHPKFSDGTVWINRQFGFLNVRPEVWEYRVGGHQVCRKWLWDRRGRQISSAEIEQYRYLVEAIGRTLRLTDEIDRAIEQAGGWPAAFVEGGDRLKASGR